MSKLSLRSTLPSELSSILYKNAVGFDPFFKYVDELINTDNPSYPPYNIEQLDENNYQVSLALAGFTIEDIDVTLENGVLTISGSIETDEKKLYLHRGIGMRSFQRNFRLADNIEVTSAIMENGILKIDLHREIPEEQKPKKINILQK
ncbi:MAG: Hsp20 family protein [Candidimonas sp.]